MGLFPVGGFPTSTAGSTIATSAGSSPRPVGAQSLLAPNGAAPATTAKSIPYGDLMMYMLQSLVQMVCALLGHPGQAPPAGLQATAKGLPAPASNTPSLPAASKDVGPYPSSLSTTTSAALSPPLALPSSVKNPAPTPAIPATALTKDATQFYSPILTQATPPPPPVAADTGIYKPSTTTTPPPTTSADTSGVYQPIPMDLANYPFPPSVNEGMVTSLPAPDLTPTDTVVYKPTAAPPPTTSADAAGVYKPIPMDLTNYPFPPSVNEGMVTSLPAPDLTPTDTVVYKSAATPPPTTSADAAGVYKPIPMDLTNYTFNTSVNEGMVTSLPAPDLTPTDTVVYKSAPPPPTTSADTTYTPSATSKDTTIYHRASA